MVLILDGFKWEYIDSEVDAKLQFSFFTHSKALALNVVTDDLEETLLDTLSYNIATHYLVESNLVNEYIELSSYYEKDIPKMLEIYGVIESSDDYNVRTSGGYNQRHYKLTKQATRYFIQEKKRIEHEHKNKQ